MARKHHNGHGVQHDYIEDVIWSKQDMLVIRTSTSKIKRFHVTGTKGNVNSITSCGFRISCIIEVWPVNQGVVFSAYNPKIDPATTNVFQTSAFRFGHSQIPDDIRLVDKTFTHVKTKTLGEVSPLKTQELPTLAKLALSQLSFSQFIILSPAASRVIPWFMGLTFGPSGADRAQVGPMLAPWTLLSGLLSKTPVPQVIYYHHDARLLTDVEHM